MLRLLPILPLLALSALGCGGDPNEVTGFLVTPRVGTNGTDEDIWFCFDTPSFAGPTCEILDGHGNDFEAGDSDTYEIELDQTFRRGDGVTGISLEDRGGGFFSDGFELVGLRVDLLLDSGDTENVCTSAEIASIDAGQSYDPQSCP